MRPRCTLNAQRGGAAFVLSFYSETSVMHRTMSVRLSRIVLLVSCLPWVIVVNDIRHSVFISPVRHDADMSFKDHNITALPLFRFGNICGQGIDRVRKKHLQVSHPSEIYICIRLCNAIYPAGCSRMSASTRACRSYPGIFQEHMLPHQCRLHSHRQDNRVFIIAAFVFRMCAHIGQCAVQNVQSGRLHRHHLRLPLLCSCGIWPENLSFRSRQHEVC